MEYRQLSRNLLAAAFLLIAVPVKPVLATSDLLEIYRLALENDPLYKAAVFGHDAAAINYPLSRTAFNPTISADTRVGTKRSDISGNHDTNRDNNIRLNVDLLVYDRSRSIEIQQSDNQVQASRLQLESAHQDLILRVADRYFNVLAARDAQEVARLEKIAIKRQLDLATQRLEVGLGTRADLFDARARLKQAEADEIKAQNAVDTRIALLRQIIGTTPEALVPLRDSAPLGLPDPDSVEEWVARALESSIRLHIQALNVRNAQHEIDRQQQARSARLTVNGGLIWADTGNDTPFASGSHTTSSVSVNLRYPLFQGGAVSLKTEQAGLQYNESERRLEEARRAVTAQTTAAFLDVSSGVSEVEALFDAITAGESALEAKEEGFNAGLTTNLDVLDAQRDLSRSRTDYLRARYNYILSVLQLEGAVGQLDEEDIRKVNGWLSAQ